MKLVKLGAIDSTNDFLKELSASSQTANFTVVTAEKQTKGRGQMGSVWSSEEGKNLIMSILIIDFLADAGQIYNLNIAFSIAVIEALEALKIPNLSIKWPNDIMSDARKIGGILIENSFKSDGCITSVVGLGLNVNQTVFENLPKASSLSLICNMPFDKEQIMFSIIENTKNNVENWHSQSAVLWSAYSRRLFKKELSMPFQNPQGKQFMGTIKGVSESGQLLVMLEDETLKTYNIKEIQMLF